MTAAPGPFGVIGRTQTGYGAEDDDVRRILVTGINGFVGRHAAPAFVRAFPDARLMGIGRTAPAAPVPGIPAPPMAYRDTDLADGAAVRDVIGAFRPTDVLHLAAASSVQQSEGARAGTWRANVGDLVTLAEAVADLAPGARFFFASTGEVYGRAFLDGCPVNEATPPQPAGTYARTKRVGEEVLTDILHGGGHRVVLMRPFNHSGPGQDERFVVPSFAAQIARIEAGVTPPVIAVGDLDARRDFLDVRDVVCAYVALVEKAEGLPGLSVFNIASGEARRIGDILEALRRLSRRPFDVRVAPERMRPSQIPVASGSAAALTAAIGWTPAVPWEDTLLSVLEDARRRVGADPTRPVTPP